jgi:hypothetical protein
MYHVYRKHPDGRGHLYHLGSYKTEAELFDEHHLGSLTDDPDKRVTVWTEGAPFTYPELTYRPYVVNDNGTILSEETLLGLWRKLHPGQSRGYGWRRSRGHYYRYPRTTQERRASAGVEREDGEPEFRSRRGFCTLPDAWDDRPIESRRNRNWKRYRKHQWK